MTVERWMGLKTEMNVQADGHRSGGQKDATRVNRLPDIPALLDGRLHGWIQCVPARWKVKDRL